MIVFVQTSLPGQKQRGYEGVRLWKEEPDIWQPVSWTINNMKLRRACSN